MTDPTEPRPPPVQRTSDDDARPPPMVSPADTGTRDGASGGGYSLVVSPRVWVLLAMLVVGIGLYVLWRTPERAGFAVDEAGGGEGAATLVLLHGYGAPGGDLMRLGEALVDAVPHLRVVCPHGPHRVGFGGRAWYRSPEERGGTAHALVALLEELVEGGTPRGRMAIGGFSQGAAMAADVSSRVPGLAGTALLSGDHSTTAPLRGPVFVSHGRADSVIGFAIAEGHIDRYRHTGPVTFFPFPGGHTVRPAEGALATWLRAVLPAAERP